MAVQLGVGRTIDKRVTVEGGGRFWRLLAECAVESGDCRAVSGNLAESGGIHHRASSSSKRIWHGGNVCAGHTVGGCNVVTGGE